MASDKQLRANIFAAGAVLWRRDDEGHIELRAATHRDPERRAYVVRESPGASHSDTEGVLPHVWRTGTPVRLGPEELAAWLPLIRSPVNSNRLARSAPTRAAHSIEVGTPHTRAGG